METSDVWDNTPGSQRKGTRYLARWKVALVFDNATNKPAFQTLTHDPVLNWDINTAPFGGKGLYHPDFATGSPTNRRCSSKDHQAEG